MILTFNPTHDFNLIYAYDLKTMIICLIIRIMFTKWGEIAASLIKDLPVDFYAVKFAIPNRNQAEIAAC